ncbi:MAG: ArsR/SmtB family transcription factor [Thermomicrobiales bacterium]
MGELVVGKPALQVNFVVSLPLDLVSVMSLLYRAVPGSGLDPWMVTARRTMPAELRADIDLLHGFTGRMLYYMEEPAMRFEPLRPDRVDAEMGEFLGFLEELPADEFRAMAGNALERVHRDLGTGLKAPEFEDDAAWRMFLQPGLTTAHIDEVVELIGDPAELKRRTIALIDGIWSDVYAGEFVKRRPALEEAAALATQTGGRGFGMAFADLTGNRLPSTLVSGLNDVEQVAFCPAYHLGSFVSYVLYPPALVVFFGAPELLERSQPRTGELNGRRPAEPVPLIDPISGTVATEELLDGLRALGDANRLRIVDLLAGRELYAQEIVGRLGIAQSAVSRHLSVLERAGIVTVRPRGGSKYYAVECGRLSALADALRTRGH